jgi:hypothetical protein
MSPPSFYLWALMQIAQKKQNSCQIQNSQSSGVSILEHELAGDLELLQKDYSLQAAHPDHHSANLGAVS